MARSISSVMMLIALCACAYAISPQEAGPYPADYKEIVELLIMKEAFDPSTMKDVSISTPHPMQIGWRKGWTVCLRGNFTNKYGAYVGLSDASIFIQDGRAVFQTEQISELCRDFDFSPWPEMEMPGGRRPVS